MTKRILSIFVALMLLMAAVGAAGAGSPVGSWSGTARGAGLKVSASATFGAGGSVTLSAGGYSASGSWSGGSLTVSAMGHTATLSYSVNGDRMTISGTYGGQKGSMSLSRTSGGEGSGVSGKAGKLSGQWSGTQGDTTYQVEVYGDGWILWTETVTSGTEEQTEVFGAKLKTTGKAIELAPLDEGLEGPAAWTTYWDEEEGIWVIPYALNGDELTLSPDGDPITLNKEDVELDAKPAHALFVPHVALKRGDCGEAVRQLQEQLVAEGHLKDEENATDGIFGAKTQSAVKAYQKANELKQDGIAGAEVRAALGE